MTEISDLKSRKSINIVLFCFAIQLEVHQDN